MRRKMIGFGIAWTCFALFGCSGGDGASDNSTPPERSLVSTNLVPLMKAKPDECYVKVDEEGHWEFNNGILDWVIDEYTRYNDIPPNTPDPDGICEDTENLGEKPKTNQAYVWGLALAVDRLWFGTGANVRCLVQGAYFGADRPEERDSGTGFLTESCEYGASWIIDPAGPSPVDLPPEMGDWRPPGIHYYDLTNRQGTYHMESSLDALGEERLNKTLGLRSAGAIGDIVFLAGPDFEDGVSKNVNMFAFRSSTAEYLGSYVLVNYSNIRKWKVIGGHLYAVLTVAAGFATNHNYGHVLKWRGTPEAPFVGPNDSAPFVVVGLLPGGGAELSEYGSDRMAVATWPGGIDEAAITGDIDITALKHAGIYISIPLPANGLSPSSAATNFTEVFTFDQYDPDLARAYTYGGGALAYFDGWLIWGSMHVPRASWQAMSLAYYGLFDLPVYNYTCRDILDPADPDKECEYLPAVDRDACIAAKYLAASSEQQAEYDTCVKMKADFDTASTSQAVSIFRGRNLETIFPEIDVLYGYETIMSLDIPLLTLLDISNGNPPGNWEEAGVSWQEKATLMGTPVFGDAGFGNLNNNYTWEMRIVNGRLYVGTMDRGGINDAVDPEAGADLYSFTSARRSAVKEDGNGLGNVFNYGFRTMLPGPPDKLYIGTANPFNLAADLNGPIGGWELLEVELQ